MTTKYLTNFITEAEYDEFLNSNECPYVNVSYIHELDENRYYKEIYAQQFKPFTIEILAQNENDKLGWMRCGVTWETNYTYTINRNGVDIYTGNGTSGWAVEFRSPTGNFETGDKISIIFSGDTQHGNEGQYTRWWRFYTNTDTEYCYVYENTLKVAVSGNIMSLYTDDYAYASPKDVNLWGSNTASFKLESFFTNFEDGRQKTYLKSAKNLFLPTRGLTPCIFEHMFTEAEYLEEAPDILAKYLPGQACSEMFKDCLRLKGMPNIAATKVNARMTFNYMFCRAGNSLGTGVEFLTTPLHINNIEGEDGYGNGYGLFEGMFYNCEHLINAPTWNEHYKYTISPEFPMGVGSFQRMFYMTFRNCYNLEHCDWNIVLVNPILQQYGPEYGLTINTMVETFTRCDALASAPQFIDGATYGDENYALDIHWFDYGNDSTTPLQTMILGTISGPINNISTSELNNVTTVYVADDSVYLDPNSQYYGQTIFSQATAQPISNYTPSN